MATICFCCWFCFPKNKTFYIHLYLYELLLNCLINIFFTWTVAWTMSKMSCLVRTLDREVMICKSTASHSKNWKCNCKIPSQTLPNRRATFAASVTWRYVSSVIQPFSVLTDNHVSSAHWDIYIFIYVYKGQASANAFIAFCGQDDILANSR